MRKTKFIALMSILACLLIVIPAGFAADNQTSFDVNETDDVLGADYYFDANVENDTGNGAIDNPYKELTYSRIKDNSVIHLASGEYDFSYSKTVSNVTIIGESATNTKITGASFTSYTSFTLHNITLIDSTVTNSGNYTAFNVIFANSSSDMYGAAINSNGNVYLENCTFINNTANCGGAIYVNGGNLVILNSSFINNTAELFGGAIVSVRTNVSIVNMTGKNNKAGYAGGAIYTFYGSINVHDSIFKNNSATTGGALFIDYASFDVIVNNRFIDNNASEARAIYSFYNFNSTISNNGNLDDDDLVETNEINMFIGDGNYTLYHYNAIDDQTIPTKYNLNDLGYVTPVKNQGRNGNCWAFATLATLESNILKALGGSFDLSESNLKNLFGTYSDYGWDYETNNGGIASMGYNYLISWLGPVLESDDPYVVNTIFSPLLRSIMHVQNVLYVQRTSFTDNDEIKRIIMTYGGIYTQIYASFTNGKQYYSGGINANHAVVVVGWDDDMEFSGAPGKGGWIIKNSWGETSPYNGFYYVSYYDTSCLPIGKTDSAFTFILNDTIKYDKNYQYDIQGKSDFFLNSSSTVWYKNKFTATDDEYLAAVSTIFEKNTDYEFMIYVNGEYKLSQSGFTKPGYHTFDLNEFIHLTTGDIFEIVFKITVNGDAGVPISENVSFTKYYYKEDTSFISYDGETWTDFINLTWEYSSHTYISQVACIKAFTILNPVNTSIILTVENTDSPSLIRALVLNEYGNPVLSGNVTFNIEGQDYVVDIVNGYASLEHAFKNFGINLITASFEKTGFISSNSNVTVNISKGNVEVSLDITVDMLDALISISLSKPINETVYVNVNQSVHEVKVINGVGKLALTDLYYGKYDVEAYFVNESYTCVNGTGSFNINYLKTFIEGSDVETYHDDGFTYSIRLVDRNNDPISGKTIRFTVGDVIKENVTDEDGIASVNFKLDVGSYTIDITCPQEGKCLESEISKSILIKSTIELPSHTTYTYNSSYVVYLLDVNGQKLANEEVTLTIGANNYTLKTDSNGMLSYDIYLTPGSYNIIVNNLNTGEVKTQNINVVKRITENKALTMYYGAGSSYKVRVFDDNGNVAKNAKVKFTVNGKTYYKYTDSKGYASLKISLKPNKYTITAEYKGFKVSNKITVKSTIIAKDKTVKKGKTIKFKAKLLNSKGKILKNKKLTFKFKGKTYKVKTNSKGIATLKITKKYKVGKYTISTKYGALKIKNKITIKK